MAESGAFDGRCISISIWHCEVAALEVAPSHSVRLRPAASRSCGA